ncbi:MAG: hypothetical protein MMC33_006726 [Icmadophila ericetorum]|nr:hypothetical protein [Icmadophila ericetorum]
MIIRSIFFPLFCILSLFILLTSAATPTSFCKCTCFSNSTIINLDPPPKPSSTAPALFHALKLARADPAIVAGPNVAASVDGSSKAYRGKNCNDCNRQFCLDYDLPICKGARVEDVFTTCFQRDSRKDEAVVFIFIIATVGLLAWALIRPLVDKWVQGRELEAASAMFCIMGMALEKNLGGDTHDTFGVWVVIYTK